MKRIFPGWIIIIILSIGAAAARAQEGELHAGVSESGFSPIRLAVPEFTNRSDATPIEAATHDILQVLWSDLDFNGYFRLVERGYYDLIPEDSTNGIPFDDWTSIGADYLLLGETDLDGQRLLVESKLYDTEHSQMMFGKRYRSEPAVWRTVAHRLADDIVLHFTGRQGISQSKIVYSTRTGEGKEIFVMDYDGAQQQQITQNGSLNLFPTWSPDGEQIAFISYLEGWPRLYVLDRDGKRTRPLPGWDGELTAAPEWSPDGRWLAFATNRDGNSEIYKMKISSGRLIRLTHHRAIDSSPSWSPTGREIAFTSDRGGRPQIYVMDAEGLNVRRVTFEGDYNDLAAWSPQGDKIAYAGRDRTFDIFLLDLATEGVQRLTFGPGNNESPRWSPDGLHLVFTSSRGGDNALYIMDAAGGRLRQIGPPRGAQSPDWSR